MLLTIFNILALALIVVILWMTCREKAATRAGRYNKIFIVIVSLVEIVLIFMSIFYEKNTLLTQTAAFICSLLLLIGLLLSYKMR